MRADLSLITPPADEPISIHEARDQVRRYDDFEDEFLRDLILEAREHVEGVTGRQLITATWEIWLDRFPGWWIDLPRPPLQTVSWVRYYDTADVLQTLSTDVWQFTAPAGPRGRRGRVVLKEGQSWPDHRIRPDAIRIQFVAGYGPGADAVPRALRRAMKLLIGHWYEHREAVAGSGRSAIPIGVKALLAPFISRSEQVQG